MLTHLTVFGRDVQIRVAYGQIHIHTHMHTHTHTNNLNK